MNPAEERAHYESFMVEPIPTISSYQREVEQGRLAQISMLPKKVLVKVQCCGSMEAILEMDGTFTLEEQTGLHSFELLWHFKQDAIRRKTHGIITNLQSMLEYDHLFACGLIYRKNHSLNRLIIK